MSSNGINSPGSMYKWIDKRPLSEAVPWTSREKFWLITAVRHYGIYNWKSVAQVVRNAGEPYRPKEWHTAKSCERQFKTLISNLSREVQLLPHNDKLQHIAECLKREYVQDANKSIDALKSKYHSLFSVLNRVKQGNLSRNEVVNLFSQAKRNEVDGKQYVDQLTTRQNVSLTLENSKTELSEEPIKWNTPSAPLLTSLLRSRNTIPANRTATTITSLLQSPGSSSRTRSGKLLPLSSGVKPTQGTPTLSKLLEAPANPYFPSVPQPVQNNKSSESVEIDMLVGNNSKKENPQSSSSLNKVQETDNVSPKFINQTIKSELSVSKKQAPKSPISAAKNGSNTNLSIVNLLSDSENEEDTANHTVQNVQLKNSLGENKESNNRLEPRATRSQTRAEGSFRQLNDGKQNDGSNEQGTLRLQIGGTPICQTDDEVIDIDQIEVEPLSSSVQDDILTQTPHKITRSYLQKTRIGPADNLLPNKVKSKEINNQMLEEISANFVLNSNLKNVAMEYKNVMVGQSRIDSSNISECLIPIDGTTVKDAIIVSKDPTSNTSSTLTSFDGKLLKQKKIIELKGSKVSYIDDKNETKYLSFKNQPIVVMNKIKKPFNIKLSSDSQDNTDNNQVAINDVKKPNPQKLVRLLDGNCSVADEVIIVDDHVSINVDDNTSIKAKELSCKGESKTVSSKSIGANDSSNSKSTITQSNEKNKIPWNVFDAPQNIIDISSKDSDNDDDGKSKTELNSNKVKTNNRFVKELDFDFDQSVSQTSLSELYNDEEIVEMHSFNNEELNSLIELNSNEPEDRQNVASLDRGDSSVSESDSIIGAFDTFAQITRVSQKSTPSKDIKSLNKESMIVKRGEEDLKHNEELIQSDEVDDQNSAVSVTGIPVLQGVISDVMSKIDSDRYVTEKTVDPKNIHSDGLVEINDDKVVVNNAKQLCLNVAKLNKSNKEQNTNVKENELKNIHEQETKVPKNVGNAYEKTSSKKENISEENKDIINNTDTIKLKNHNINIIKEIVPKNMMEMENDTKLQETAKEKIELKVKSSIEDKPAKTDEIIEIETKIIEEKSQHEGLNVVDIAEKPKADGKEADKNEVESEIVCKAKEVMKKQLGADIAIRAKEAIKRGFEAEILKKAKESMKDEFEAEIMRRVSIKSEMNKAKSGQLVPIKLKENPIQNLKHVDLKKMGLDLKKAETMKFKEDEVSKLAKETEVCTENEQKSQESKIESSRDDEIHKDMKAETEQAKEAMLKKSKEEELKEAKDVEIQRTKEREAELQRVKDEEIEKAKVAEIQRVKEEELKKAKDTEIQKVKEDELKKAKEAEIQKAQEAVKKQREQLVDIQKTKDELKKALEEELNKSREERLKRKVKEEVEIQKAKDLVVKKAKESELKKVKEEAETLRAQDEELKIAKEDAIRKAREESELRKAKEIEQRKALEAEINEKSKKNSKTKETEIINTKNMAARDLEIKKVKDVEMKKNIQKSEEKLQNEKELLAFEEQSKKTKKIERTSLEIKKTSVKESGKKELEAEIIKKKDSESNKVVENVKTIDTEAAKSKILTRTRGLKVEDKLIESNIASKNIPNKSGSLIKSLEPLSTIPSTSVRSCNTNFDHKSEIKNANDVSKRKISITTSVELYDDGLHNTDSESIKTENMGGKSRTRSSLGLKQSKILETGPPSSSSYKRMSSEREFGHDLQTSVGPKVRILTSLRHDVSTTTANINNQHNTQLVDVSSKALSDHKCSKNLTVNIVKLNTDDLPIAKERSDQRSDNSSLKQQGIKVTNNEFMPSKSTDANEKPTPKKRGRKRRIDVQNEKQSNSSELTLQNGAPVGNKLSANHEAEPPAKRTRRSVELRSNKVEQLNKFSAPENSKKKDLKIVYNNLCENNKYLSTISKRVKGTTPEMSVILKWPVELHIIRKSIASGKIATIDDLQVYLLMMSFNAVMINKSETIVFSDAANFQTELQNNALQLQGAVDEDDGCLDKNDEQNEDYLHLVESEDYDWPH